MTAMEIQQWKKNFNINYLDKIDSMEMMEKLEKYAKRMLNKKETVLSPLAFSLEEANREIDLAEQELSEGKGIREPEMHQFFEEWKQKLK